MDLSNLDFSAFLNLAATLVTTWGVKVVAAIALFVVGQWVARWMRKWIRNGLERGKMDPTLVPFLSSMVYYLAVAFVVVAVLGTLGIPTASLVALLGAAGLALALALQGTLSNFAAGVMLLIFRPFQVGDYVEVGGTAGSVVAIGIFSTRLNTPDNVGITVPNSSVWGSTIRNFAANPTRRVDLVVGISYGDDIGRAIETVSGLLQAETRVLDDPAPFVAVSELADSSVNLVVRPWCKREDFWSLRCDLTRALKEQLEAAGFSIPFPQRDMHVHQVGQSAA
jgi:small conductance mechanosensitive channel